MMEAVAKKRVSLRINGVEQAHEVTVPRVLDNGTYAPQGHTGYVPSDAKFVDPWPWLKS